jgi:non-ribosomal peptide synthetase component F
LVAHYLIHKGIQREDVVMIYAYRGVDLVIAIMGVLKAGATFSVIGKLGLEAAETETRVERRRLMSLF